MILQQLIMPGQHQEPDNTHLFNTNKSAFSFAFMNKAEKQISARSSKLLCSPSIKVHLYALANLPYETHVCVHLNSGIIL